MASRAYRVDSPSPSEGNESGHRGRDRSRSRCGRDFTTSSTEGGVDVRLKPNPLPRPELGEQDPRGLAQRALQFAPSTPGVAAALVGTVRTEHAALSRRPAMSRERSLLDSTQPMSAGDDLHPNLAGAVEADGFVVVAGALSEECVAELALAVESVASGRVLMETDRSIGFPV